jgi:hypothetical protein
VEDLTVTMDEPGAYPFAKSNFATGIVTFELGWLFRTSPGYDLWAMGPPNDPKDGIAPLSGLIETDWLPYTFTMNWKMTRPGVVRFEKGEPFCFLTPTQIAAVADCQPVERRLADDADLQASLAAWSKERADFMERFWAGDPEALKNPWGRRYFKGRTGPRRASGPAGAALPEAEGQAAGDDTHDHLRRRRAGPGLPGGGRPPPGRHVRAPGGPPRREPDRFERPAETFWQGRLLGYREIRDVDPTAAAAVQEALAWAACKVRGFYGVDAPLFADVAHLVGWREGQSMPPHADNAHRDGTPHALAHRAYSGVIYLERRLRGRRALPAAPGHRDQAQAGHVRVAPGRPLARACREAGRARRPDHHGVLPDLRSGAGRPPAAARRSRPLGDLSMPYAIIRDGAPVKVFPGVPFTSSQLKITTAGGGGLVVLADRLGDRRRAQPYAAALEHYAAEDRRGSASTPTPTRAAPGQVLIGYTLDPGGRQHRRHRRVRPPPVPTEVERWQAKQALRAAGKLEAVEARSPRPAMK